MILFADSSALIKIYFAEAGSAAMSAAVFNLPVAVSDLTFAEVHAAFSRRKREALLTLAEYDEMCSRFHEDWQDFAHVGVRSVVLARVPTLCESHALRGADAVQLASALVLRQAEAVRFASSDRKLLAAAEMEQLEAFDPAQLSTD